MFFNFFVTHVNTPGPSYKNGTDNILFNGIYAAPRALGSVHAMPWRSIASFHRMNRICRSLSQRRISAAKGRTILPGTCSKWNDDKDELIKFPDSHPVLAPHFQTLFINLRHENRRCCAKTVRLVEERVEITHPEKHTHPVFREAQNCLPCSKWSTFWYKKTVMPNNKVFASRNLNQVYH
jgi:hypothetical protein